MPPVLSVEARDGLIELATLDDSQFGCLTKAIAERKPGMYPNEAAWWPREIEGVPPPVFRRILDAILTIRWSIVSRGGSPSEESIADIVDQAAARGRLEPATVERLKGRVRGLNSIQSLAVSSRAYFLAFANPHSLIRSRVVTDIRTVFESAKSTEIMGALVLHSLQMECAAGGGDVEDIYVTLDSRDVNNLIEQLQRAQAKGEVIAATLRRVDVEVLPATVSEETQV